MTEHRSFRSEHVRAFEDSGAHFVSLQVVKYGVVDEYKTVWMPGCFNRSISQRWPTLAWGHEWTEIIGRADNVVYNADGPVLRFRLDDFDAVPRAKQAYAQLRSGTIDDCSVGFSNLVARPPTPEELTKWPGAQQVMLDADLDEVSLVLRGAVPGAKVVAVRSRPTGQKLSYLESAQIDIEIEQAVAQVDEIMKRAASR